MYSANPTRGVTVSPKVCNLPTHHPPIHQSTPHNQLIMYLQVFPKPPSSKPDRQFVRHIAGPDGDYNDTYAGPANRYAAPKDTSEIPCILFVLPFFSSLISFISFIYFLLPLLIGLSFFDAVVVVYGSRFAAPVDTSLDNNGIFFLIMSIFICIFFIYVLSSPLLSLLYAFV